jgi:protoporphyrinogen oxidase
MRSGEVGGAVVDVGVQLLASTFRDVFALTRDAGAESLLVRAPGRDALWREGRAHSITYGSVTSMAASTALPGMLKLKLVTKYLPYLAARCVGLDVNDPAGTGGVALDDVSIGAWGRTELGDDFVELMVYPFLASYYGSIPEETTAPLYHAFARIGMDVSLYAARGGMGGLAGAWAGAIGRSGGSVETDVDVDSVEAEGDGVTVRIAGAERRYDAAVIAVPAPEAVRLVEWPSAVASWLSNVRTNAADTLAILLDRPLRSDWFGLSIPRREPVGRTISVICDQSQKRSETVPQGNGLAMIFPAPGAMKTLASQEPEAVAHELIGAADTLIPGFERSVVHAKLFRDQHGFTQFPPGHLHSIVAFDDSAVPARLALAGDYRVAPTVEGAVLSGLRAADRLIRAS